MVTTDREFIIVGSVNISFIVFLSSVSNPTISYFLALYYPFSPLKGKYRERAQTGGLLDRWILQNKTHLSEAMISVALI